MTLTDLGAAWWCGGSWFEIRFDWDLSVWGLHVLPMFAFSPATLHFSQSPKACTLYPTKDERYRSWMAHWFLNGSHFPSPSSVKHIWLVPLQIAFFKDCGEDDVCTTDLVLQAHMDISGTRYRFDTFLSSLSSVWSVFGDFPSRFLHRQKPYVIRSPRRRLAVEVQLQNRLENAYNTSLTLHYSRNLHFSSLSIRVDNVHAAPLLTNHTHLGCLTQPLSFFISLLS